MKIHIEVVGAVFINDHNQIFCTQRKNVGELALKWEFSGGKVELGETPQEALKREIKEELEKDITVLDHFLTIKYEYKTFTILFNIFLCAGLLTGYKLNDHENAQWINIIDLLELDWAETDLPIVKKIMGELN